MRKLKCVMWIQLRKSDYHRESGLQALKQVHSITMTELKWAVPSLPMIGHHEVTHECNFFQIK